MIQEGAGKAYKVLAGDHNPVLQDQDADRAATTADQVCGRRIKDCQVAEQLLQQGLKSSARQVVSEQLYSN